MIPTFTFQGAGKIVFGDGVAGRLPAEVKALLGSKVLLVCDQGLRNTGAVEKVVEPLNNDRIRFALFDRVTSEPAPQLADAASQMATQQACDMVVGVGGGSSLDVAKAAAVLVTNGGRAQDYIGLNKVPKPGLPTIMMPTTAGTGSEATFTAVFTMREVKKKGGINSPFLYPKAALLDPLLTLTLPPGPTATTGMDALTHAIEAYTSLQANPMSDLVASEAISLVGANLRRAFLKGNDLSARRAMLLGSLLGGLAIASAGVGACHALAYPLGAFFDVPHGLANAVLLPYVMEFNCPSAGIKYGRVAASMGRNSAAAASSSLAQVGVEVVRDLARDVGIPQGLRALNIPESAIEEMAEAAMKVDRPIANNPRTMSKEAAIAIYEKAFSQGC